MLAGVYPLILVVLVLERQRVALKLRRTRFFRVVLEGGVACALIGLVLSIVGVQIKGYPTVLSMPAWVVFGAGVVALALHSLMILAAHEISDEDLPSRGREGARTHSLRSRGASLRR